MQQHSRAAKRRIAMYRFSTHGKNDFVEKSKNFAKYRSQSRTRRFSGFSACVKPRRPRRISARIVARQSIFVERRTISGATPTGGGPPSRAGVNTHVVRFIASTCGTIIHVDRRIKDARVHRRGSSLSATGVSRKTPRAVRKIRERVSHAERRRTRTRPAGRRSACDR